MEKSDVFQYLKMNYDQLTDSQKIIGKYVLDNYREVAFMTAVELAEKVGVSDATIIRFTRSIGFKGFIEFKNSIRDSIKNADAPYKRLSKNTDNQDKKENLIMKVGNKDLENLKSFLMNINLEKIEEGVQAIFDAQTIYLIGLRSSGLETDFLAFHLRRMGFKIVQVTHGGLVSIEKIMNISKNDLLISCCLPRYSKPSYSTITLAKEKGAKILTITDNNLSSISSASDIVYHLPIDNFTFFNSHVVPMEFCNILVMSILEKDKDLIYRNLEKNIESVDIFDEYL